MTLVTVTPRLQWQFWQFPNGLSHTKNDVDRVTLAYNDIFLLSRGCHCKRGRLKHCLQMPWSMIPVHYWNGLIQFFFCDGLITKTKPLKIIAWSSYNFFLGAFGAFFCSFGSFFTYGEAEQVFSICIKANLCWFTLHRQQEIHNHLKSLFGHEKEVLVPHKYFVGGGKWWNVYVMRLKVQSNFKSTN